MALQKSLSDAGATAYKAFLESYNPQDNIIELKGQKLRFKMVSPKTFLIRFIRWAIIVEQTNGVF